MAGAAPLDPMAASVDPEQVARFAALAEAWWDPDGRFRPLHRLNPTRVAFIRDRLCDHFGRDPAGTRPLAGLRLLDIGCGGGLLSEPMTRLGATVVGVDAAEKNIGIARIHAAESALDIDYLHTTAEALAEAGEVFDAILNMEVVEHVADLDAFLGACCRMLGPPTADHPGGAMVVATLNRTPAAFALAIVGAEYLLRWLPRGTHDWRRFVRPSELAGALRRHGVTVREMRGVSYNPLADRWRLSADLSVNYMAFAAREA